MAKFLVKLEGRFEQTGVIEAKDEAEARVELKKYGVLDEVIEWNTLEDVDVLQVSELRADDDVPDAPPPKGALRIVKPDE